MKMSRILIGWMGMLVSEGIVSAAKVNLPARLAPDFAKERKTLISPFPPPAAGAVSFDASRMKPLVSDDKTFRIEKNTPVPGVSLASIGDPALLIREPDNDGGYWPLTGLAAGNYFVGVSGDYRKRKPTGSSAFRWVVP